MDNDSATCELLEIYHSIPPTEQRQLMALVHILTSDEGALQDEKDAAMAYYHHRDAAHRAALINVLEAHAETLFKEVTN